MPVRLSRPLPGLCREAVVAVKYWDLPGALRAAREAGAERVWMLLNGLLGGREAERLGYEPRYIVSTYGATRLGPLEVRLGGEGEHLIGSPRGLDVWSCRLARLLRAGGARAWCTGMIEVYRWGKAAVNAAINGVTSILDAPNGVVAQSRYAWAVARRAALEVARSARCRGVPVGDRWVVGWLRRVAEETGGNVSSMLQDLRACRRTEAPAIYGPVLQGRCGRGLETIETLYMLVRALEEGDCVAPGQKGHGKKALPHEG